MKQTLTLLAALCLHTMAYAQTWTVDKVHSSLNFAVTHMQIAEINGRFKDFEAKITSAKADFSDAKFEISAPLVSITTDHAQRDEHLKSPDFFDAAKFPTLKFVSASISNVAGKTFKLIGDLTLHGVTKRITLELVFNGTAVDPVSKKTKAGFQISGTIKRSDFGIGPGSPSVFISDEVKIKANGEFVKD